MLGVSGGVDSVVLLDVLAGIALKHGVPLTVAHANHGLRKEADDDAAWVRQLASGRGFPCIVSRLDVCGERTRGAGSVEMAARRLRHAFFARTAREAGAGAVALAHHGDDQVELLLLRLFRGSGGDGLGGMAEVSPSPADPGITLVRPLLGVTKSDVLEHARQRGLEFREDCTNRDTSIPRNHLRQTVLPWLREQIGEHLNEVVRRSAELVRADAECVEDLAREWLSSPRPRAFRRLPVAVQRAAIRRQLWEMGCPVEFDLIERLRHSGAHQSAAAGRIIARNPVGRVADVEARPDFTFATHTFELRTHGKLTFAGVRLQWRHSKVLGSSGVEGLPGEEQLDAAAIGGRVTVRHWQPGDRFQSLGMPRAAKLQNLFTNRKVPAAERRRRLVAATAEGTIFWVEGLPPGEAFKVRVATRLRLHWSWKRNAAGERTPRAARQSPVG